MPNARTRIGAKRGRRRFADAGAGQSLAGVVVVVVVGCFGCDGVEFGVELAGGSVSSCLYV